jgi:hypothetical protein
MDIYTYVPEQETASADSEHCNSARTNSSDNKLRTKPATILQQTTRNFAAKEVVVPMHARHSVVPASTLVLHAPTYNYPYQHPTSQPHFSDTSPQSQGFDSYVGSHRGLDIPAVSDCGTSSLDSFAPMVASTLEGYQTTREEQGETYAMDGMATTIEVDGMNLWWDQSSENCEIEPSSLLGGVYSWNRRGGYFVDSDR